MPRDKTYAIVAMELELEDATVRRNLGCPRYDDCLHKANDELFAAYKAYKAKCKAGGRLKAQERYSDGSHTWVCADQCPFRHVRSAYDLRLRQPAPEE